MPQLQQASNSISTITDGHVGYLYRCDGYRTNEDNARVTAEGCKNGNLRAGERAQAGATVAFTAAGCFRGESRTGTVPLSNSS